MLSGPGTYLSFKARAQWVEDVSLIDESFALVANPFSDRPGMSLDIALSRSSGGDPLDWKDVFINFPVHYIVEYDGGIRLGQPNQTHLPTLALWGSLSGTNERGYYNFNVKSNNFTLLPETFNPANGTSFMVFSPIQGTFVLDTRNRTDMWLDATAGLESFSPYSDLLVFSDVVADLKIEWLGIRINNGSVIDSNGTVAEMGNHSFERRNLLMQASMKQVIDRTSRSISSGPLSQSEARRLQTAGAKPHTWTVIEPGSMYCKLIADPLAGQDSVAEQCITDDWDVSTGESGGRGLRLGRGLGLGNILTIPTRVHSRHLSAPDPLPLPPRSHQLMTPDMGRTRNARCAQKCR